MRQGLHTILELEPGFQVVENKRRMSVSRAIKGTAEAR